MEQEKKIRVLHFDVMRTGSKNLRNKLKDSLDKIKKIDYQDITEQNKDNYLKNNNTIEQLLPQKDIFLVNPGQKEEDYGALFKSLSTFRNVEFMLVTPINPNVSEGILQYFWKFKYNEHDKILQSILDYEKRHPERFR